MNPNAAGAIRDLGWIRTFNRSIGRPDQGRVRSRRSIINRNICLLFLKAQAPTSSAHNDQRWFVRYSGHPPTPTAQRLLGAAAVGKISGKIRCRTMWMRKDWNLQRQQNPREIHSNKITKSFTKGKKTSMSGSQDVLKWGLVDGVVRPQK